MMTHPQKVLWQPERNLPLQRYCEKSRTGAETLDSFAVRWHVLSLVRYLEQRACSRATCLVLPPLAYQSKNSLHQNSTVKNNISGTLPLMEILVTFYVYSYSVRMFQFPINNRGAHPHNCFLKLSIIYCFNGGITNLLQTLLK